MRFKITRPIPWVDDTDPANAAFDRIFAGVFGEAPANDEPETGGAPIEVDLFCWCDPDGVHFEVEGFDFAPLMELHHWQLIATEVVSRLEPVLDGWAVCKLLEDGQTFAKNLESDEVYFREAGVRDWHARLYPPERYDSEGDLIWSDFDVDVIYARTEHLRAAVATADAKRQLTAQRRVEYGRQRAALALAMIEAGKPYLCTCGEAADLTIDHIIPLSRGGTDDLANLRFLCAPCNSRKGARMPLLETVE